MRERSACFWSLLLLLTLFPPMDGKRGGTSIGRSMGRGSSGARSGGGLFGSSRSRGSAPPAHTYPKNTNMGGQRSQQPSGSWGSGGGGWSGSSNRGTANRNSGGWSGSRTSSSGGLFGRGGGGGLFGRSSHGFSPNGVGSRGRSSQFKNMIVGAAAGYLTYQAGKAIIRAATRPMMWNNRQYYWGQSYYQPRHGQTNMCRMPLDSSDQQFGNVYFQDQSRPREIVWGCGFGEYCCGYECCRGGGASGYGHGVSMGYAIALYAIARAYLL